MEESRMIRTRLLWEGAKNSKVVDFQDPFSSQWNSFQMHPRETCGEVSSSRPSTLSELTVSWVGRLELT